jgi:flagellar biosynthesis GTPase FlhF
LAEPQRFEGPSIEDVLAEVRSRLGADAEIVEANKVRSGGVGGFFARERYEVLARPAPATAPPEPLTPAGLADLLGVAAPPPASLLDVADLVSEAERAHAAEPPAPAPAPASAPVPGGPRSRAEVVAQQAMAAHLRRIPGTAVEPEGATAARVAAQEVAATARAAADAAFEPLRAADLPRLSADAPAFTDVLTRIAGEAGPEVRAAVDARIAAAQAARAADGHGAADIGTRARPAAR